MIVVILLDVKSSWTLFENILSVSNLECVVPRIGVEMKRRRKFAYIESKDVALSLFVSYFRGPILKSPINIHSLHPHFLLGDRLSLLSNFQKGGLWRTSVIGGGLPWKWGSPFSGGVAVFT